jgi:hypothetical protein
MYNEDPLCENANITGMKWVMVMFVFLFLIAWPMIQLTLGGELNVLSAGLNSLASSAGHHQF